MLYATIGLLGKQFYALEGINAGKVSIDVDKAGLYAATVALVSAKGLGRIQKDGTVARPGKELDRGVISKTSMIQ
ncbi:hypothetical protein JDV02_001851 [Purpureocillium takamizusanense]|uniref:Uncharacterized protein n=1 Tax=Purpureocillium takamizusanense TaxID=2060973 RepID=A0A9Q8Q831_9HYPO|nr:uncharacterized protein JDV02_001851 [Purpureocillium takamizusanense]UNI15308.1 hypothetical protein JDV02_001851 [Purpureocillium takamizusanense]